MNEQGTLGVASADPPADAEVLLSPGWRILVVDDNADAATSLSTLLQLFGHRTRVALSGRQALREAQDFRPDGVLLDIELPDMDGWQVAQSLRATTWGADCVLLALTGLNSAPDRQRSREAGFDGHLVKPVRPEALVRQLAGLLADGAWTRRLARAGAGP